MAPIADEELWKRPVMVRSRLVAFDVVVKAFGYMKRNNISAYNSKTGQNMLSCKTNTLLALNNKHCIRASRSITELSMIATRIWAK